MKHIFKISLFIITALMISSCSNQKIPRPDHIIIVMEENHGYDEVIGSENAPFFNELANGGALFTDSHGVIHPSQPNYLAIFSGSIQGVTNDNCLDTLTDAYSTPNLGAALIKSGLTFKGYAQNLPSVGFKGCDNLKSDLTGMNLYARKHAPWVNWQGTGENNIPDNVSLPMSQFPADFSKLPTVAFVIPDMDNDMHNIGKPGDTAAIKRADTWLKGNLSAYAKWAKTHNSLLIVTFDEDDFKNVNHIPTIFYGQPVKPGKYNERIDHYNVLRTLTSMYNVKLSDTTSATAIEGVWKK